MYRKMDGNRSYVKQNKTLKNIYVIFLYYGFRDFSLHLCKHDCVGG